MSERLNISSNGQSADFSSLEAAYPGTLQEHSKESIDASVALSRVTLAPQSIDAFRATMPSLQQVQSTLFGAKLGSQLDWNSISESGNGASRNSTDTEIAEELMSGGVEILFAATPTSRSVSTNSVSAFLHDSTSQISFGSFCNSDGTVVIFSSQMGEGEGGSGDENAEGGGVAVPTPYAPSLYLAGDAGQIKTFVPPDQNSAVVITFGGSFNESSLANPDMNATGDNWVHKIDRNWTSPTQWSITETVISVYSLGDSETTVHDVADLDEGDSSNEGSSDSNEGDGTDEPSELEETGSWETTISTSRRGFVIMTLHASMGITSPSAAGVLWSVSLNYSDSVTVGAVAGGGSSFAPAEEEGDAASSGSTGRDTAVPPDFEGSADWGASFGVTGRSGGTIYITSTPSLASDGSIRSTVDADVTYDIGGDANFRSNWSSSSQSGDLELPDLSGGDTPSNGGPTLSDLGQAIGDASAEFQGSDLSQRGGSDPSDFVGEIVGHGHRAASGGGGASRLGGGVTGGFNMQAVIGGSGFESLTGDAFAALQGDTGGEGKSEHFFVYAPAPKVEMTSAGLTTSKIVLVHAWDIDGTEDELADTLKNDSVSASLSGQMVLDPDGSTAEIDGDADLTGFTVLAIVASIKSVQDLSGPSSTGYKTRDQTLDYVSIERGKGLGDYRSAVNATVDGGADLLEGDDGAGISSDINARTYTRIKLVDDQKLLYTNHQDIGSWVDEFKTDDKDKMTIILTTYSTIVGNVNGILQSDDSVAWSGLANDETVTHVEYVRNWRRVDSAISPNESSNYTYVNFRNANFDGKVIQTNVLNAVAGTVTSTFVRSGDVEVHAVSSSAGNHELPTQFEKELESIITGEMPPEVEVWDGTTHPIVSERPSTGYTMAMIGWFGGTAGDSADQVIYFTAGVADSITPTSYWVRHGSEYFWGTHIDENGNAYFVGQVTGTTVSFVMPGGAAVNKLSNSFDDMGRCANWLAKLRHGGCFVAGTKVTVSELPYSEARESSVWSETDWLSNDDYSFSPSPRFGEKGPGDEGHGSEKLEVRSANSSEAELGVLAYPTKAISLLIPIEQVPLGARVPTKNPKPWEYDDSLPDPVQADWAKIAITMHRNDGGIVDAELLRPRWWIAQHSIVAGKHLPMNIEELQVHGSALVTSIEDCPEIADGEGSVVTAKFLTREVNTLARVEILGVDGQIEVLEGTTIHPIWSVDRDDWIQLSELQEGERLQAANGFAIVVSVAIVNTSVPVYNIEVHGEHAYQVGELGLLVHNECVYQALDQAGNIIYVGITKNFATRQAQHASRFQIQPIIQGLTRSDARAIEQRLIETIGLGKNGGTLLNKINSIAFSNPVYATAIQRAIALGF